MRCRVGSVLAQTANTVCSGCYARKGRFKFSNVQARLEQAYQGLFSILWTPALIHQIRWYADRYFRLFHSGDLQGVPHLKNLCTVARNVPDVQFWLPTREYEVVVACKSDIPENLVVRMSAQKMDGTPPRWWKTTSTVVSDPEVATCPAPEQGGNCGECRECWKESVRNVAYLKH